MNENIPSRKGWVSLILVGALFSCNIESTETRSNYFKKINDDVLQNTQAYATLGEVCTTIGHRLTGSENGKKAEEYTYNKFKSYGFQDVKYDEFEMTAWSRGDILVEVDGISVPAVSLAYSPLNVDLTGTLIDMGNGLESDYVSQAENVKGKIVVAYLGILEGSSDELVNLHRSEKAALAIRYGAKGIILYNSVPNGVLLTGTASVTGDILPVPAICISKEEGMKITQRLRKESMETHIAMTNYSDAITTRNVVATIMGSEKPEEKIIVGGHLDSWDLATGAIDNGIGSFAVLDIARTFMNTNIIPKRTIHFVMFMGEEQGLFGSWHMVKKALEDGSIDDIKFIMNIDMSGNPIGFNVGGVVNDSTFFSELGADIRQVDESFKNEFTNVSTLHSDHEPFMLQGIPYIDPISDLDQVVYDCYHSNCDSFDLVNEMHIRNTVRFMSMALYGLVNAETLPATRTDSETTKQLMIKNELQEPLTIAGDWKWGDENSEE